MNARPQKPFVLFKSSSSRATSVLVLLFLYAPIGLIFLSSFFSTRYLNDWQPFSFDWYRQAFLNQAMIEAAETSLAIALLTSLLATGLGTAIALALYRFRIKRKQLIFGTLLLPIVLPEIVMGIGLLLFFSRFLRPLSSELFGISLGSVPAVVAGHVAFCISYVVLLVGARLGSLDPRLDEAGLDLGATPFQVLTHICLPQCTGAVMSGALLAFTLSLDDFYISYFASAGGSGFRTLPIQLYAMQTRSGVTPEMNAVASLLLFLSMSLMSIAFFLNRKSLTRS